MKRMLNTLYVTSQGAYLSLKNETVVVRVEKEVKLRVPLLTLSGIVCFGRITLSTGLIGSCALKNISVCFLSYGGRFMARLVGPVSGNVLLRREQYRMADDDCASAQIARSVVIGKVANCRTVLLRAAREKPDTPRASALDAAARHLGSLLEELRTEMPVDSVRAKEGEAARAYFDVFDHLITAQKDHFFFRGRSRRPPMDSMNSLLSFYYAILANDVSSALQTVGLDSAVGFLHRDRPGRPGLALDLMEEMRPVLADRLALSLVNLQQVKGKGFKKTESGGVLMDDATRKEVLTAYQKRKQEELHHPFLDEKIPVGMIPFAQAMLMARYIRGDLDAYPPFLWK